MPEEEIMDQEQTSTSNDEALAEGAEEPQTDATQVAEPQTIEEQLAAEQDRALRLQAELQNVLMRKSRDVAEERKYGPLALMRDLLPVLDNIDRALDAAGKSGDTAGGLVEGFQLVRQQLLTVFEQHQCQRIETAGAPFDPDRHDAILQQPSDEVEAGSVMMETQSGYLLHDRVVRPAQVIVSSGPAAAE